MIVFSFLSVMEHVPCNDGFFFPVGDGSFGHAMIVFSFLLVMEHVPCNDCFSFPVGDGTCA